MTSLDNSQQSSPAECPKPVIVISKCLLGAQCRWDGTVLENEIVQDLRKKVKFISFCPETSIGMGVPRAPIRLVEENERSGVKVIQPTTGWELTDELREDAHSFLEGLEEVDGFLLKYKSPSCGIRDVKLYPTAESDAVKGFTNGIFARAVRENFPLWPIIDDVMIEDETTREQWLSGVFIFARFYQVQRSGDRTQLEQFHLENAPWLSNSMPEAYRQMDALLQEPPTDSHVLFRSYGTLFHRFDSGSS